MSVTEYTPVTWSPGDSIDIEKLQAMTSNTQILAEKIPGMLYKNGGVTKEKGLKIFATDVIIPPTNLRGIGGGTAYFGGLFTPGCVPVVTAMINTYPQMRFHVATKGVGQKDIDHRGVEVYVYADELNGKNNVITNSVRVGVIAIGW